MKIAVIGTGYVGLITGVCLAKVGHSIVCIDNDREKIQTLSKSESPFYEPGLSELLQETTKAGNITFSEDLESIHDSQAVFLTLPTPQDSDGSADISILLQVAKGIASYLKEGAVVINKSTAPVGTIEKIRNTIKTENTGAIFQVVSNPEFLREGVAIGDFMNPDRIVIGSDNNQAKEVMNEVYEYWKNQTEILHMNIASSELAKYVANGMLALKVSFINEMSRLSESLGADIMEIKKVIGSDHRIGPHFIHPGLGYGGSCFPKDVEALVHMGKEHGINSQITTSIKDGNQLQRKHFLKKISAIYDGQFAGKKLTLWGASFKPETDDVRESPAIYLAEKLLEFGAQVVIYDPIALPNLQKTHPNLAVTYEEDQESSIEESDGIILATEWKQNVQAPFEKYISKMKKNILIDGRNCLDPQKMKELGFQYHNIG